MMQEARPFFLLDWLDDLMVNQDAFQIAELLKTPSKLPKTNNKGLLTTPNANHHNHLHSYHMTETVTTETSSSASSSSSSMMLRSISSPQVMSAYETPRSSNCKKTVVVDHHSCNDHSNHHHHGILPTRLFSTSNTNTSSSNTSIPRSQSHSHQNHHQNQHQQGIVHQPFKKRSMALGNGWNAKGLTKAKQGKWEAALACWDNALEIRLQISDQTSRKDQLEVANTWNNRGIALGKLGQYHNAIDALQEAYEIRAALLEKGHPQVVSTLHNIANVHQQQGDLTTALQVFGNAKSLLVQQSSTTTTTTTTNNTKNNKKNNNSDPMLLARICTAIGHIYYQAQQWIDSRDAYQDALNILLQHNNNNNNSNDHQQQQQQQQQQQREIYELERDIQELNAKISISNFHGSPATVGALSASSLFHGYRSPPQQSPQH